MHIPIFETDAESVVLDLAQALGDVNGDLGLLRELAEYFAEDAPKICSDLGTEASQQAWDKAIKLARRLKNMASQFRAEPTTALAAHFENLILLKACDEITPRSVHALKSSVNVMIEVLRAEKLLK